MENRHSFEEFLFVKDGKFHHISEVENEYELNQGNISKFRGSMFCPECQEAKLSFTMKTSKRRAYLSSIRLSNHASNCSYKYEYATKNQIKEAVKNMNKNEIHDKLEATLNMLLKPKTKNSNHSDTNEHNNNPFVINTRSDNISIRRTIPRKSLNGWLDKNELKDGIFIFYGKNVRLSIEQTVSGDFYNLIIKTRNSKGDWVFKTKVFRSKHKDDIMENIEYNIAMLGYINPKYNHSITLEKQDALLYRHHE